MDKGSISSSTAHRCACVFSSVFTPWPPSRTGASLPFEMVNWYLSDNYGGGGGYFCPSALRQATEHPGNLLLPGVSSPLCMLFFATVSRWGPCSHNRTADSTAREPAKGCQPHASSKGCETQGLTAEARLTGSTRYRAAEQAFCTQQPCSSASKLTHPGR